MCGEDLDDESLCARLSCGAGDESQTSMGSRGEAVMRGEGKTPAETETDEGSDDAAVATVAPSSSVELPPGFSESPSPDSLRLFPADGACSLAAVAFITLARRSARSSSFVRPAGGGGGGGAGCSSPPPPTNFNRP